MKDETIKQALQVLFEEHNLNKIYKKLSIVTHTINEDTNIYQAISNVPRHVAITDKNYWKQINASNSSQAGSEPVQEQKPDNVDYLCFTANNDNCSLRLYCSNGSEDADPSSFNFEYSTDDGATWIDWPVTYIGPGYMSSEYGTEVIVFEHAGDKVLIRGNNPNGTYRYIDGKWIGLKFAGAKSVYARNNSFAVSGDLQTIVDKYGRNNVAPNFRELFYTSYYGVNGIVITTAPKLSATVLTPTCYYNLFCGQSLLTSCAEIGDITFESLIGDNNNLCMSFMYSSCTGLTSTFSLSSLELPSNFTQEDIEKLKTAIGTGVFNSCNNITITTNNCRTLSPLPNIEFPLTTTENEVTTTTTGFDFTYLVFGIYKNANTATISISYNQNARFKINGFFSDYKQVGTINQAVSLEAIPKNGYRFVKWTGGGLPDSTDNPRTFTINQNTNSYMYFNAVFEQVTPIDYLCFTVLQSDTPSTISMYSSFNYIIDLEYSTDQITWYPFVENNQYITINGYTGESYYFRGTNSQIQCSFILNGKWAVSGDINTIFNRVGGNVEDIWSYSLLSTYFGGVGPYDISGLLMPSETNFQHSNLFEGANCLMSDDGSNFIFDYRGILPVTNQDIEYSTPLDIAITMGNVNGFDLVEFSYQTTNSNNSYCYLNSYNGLFDNAGTYKCNPNTEVTMVTSGWNGAVFIKWQESTDGENWTDISGATSTTLTVTFTQTGRYYYRAYYAPSLNIPITNNSDSTITCTDTNSNSTTINARSQQVVSVLENDTLTFSPSSIEENESTLYLKINGSVKTTYTITRYINLRLTYE